MSITTRTSICNHALSLIGDQNIASFDENTARAERCRNIYDQVRKSILRDHPWSCAKARTILAPVTTYPDFGYKHAFPLPRDYIRIVSANTEQYEVENRYILANTDAIQLEYIFDNDNEDSWDSMLVEAMSLKMAAKLCKPNTGSDAAGQSADAQYRELIQRAKAINAQERPAQDMLYVDESRYIGSRY